MKVKTQKENKIGKGDFGYINYARKKQLIYTIVLFGVSFALLLGGYLLVHTKANLLTLVAVLGMLPASKSLVNSIMFFRAKGCSKDDYDHISTHVGDLLVLYDLYFTSEKKNFPVSSMVLKGNTICYYMNESEDMIQQCQNHLKGIFTQNQFKGYTIKGFSSVEQFTDRMDSLKQASLENTEIDSFVVRTLLSICL